jgi:hypothetical protein
MAQPRQENVKPLIPFLIHSFRMREYQRRCESPGGAVRRLAISLMRLP